jgi:DNA-binding GntR family transcriptional regulator
MATAARAGKISVLIDRDLEFHRQLYELSGHSLLREVLSGLQQRMRLALAFADAVYSAD